MLQVQGRLGPSGRAGEHSYDSQSVYRMRAENIIRGMTEEAWKDCADLEADVGELAAVQYQRGLLRGTADVFKNDFRAIGEELRKAEAKPEAEAKPDA